MDTSDGATTASTDGLGNTKAALEVSRSFNEVSNFTFSYLVRTAFELVEAGGLLAILFWKGLPILQEDKFIFCDVTRSQHASSPAHAIRRAALHSSHHSAGYCILSKHLYT